MATEAERIAAELAKKQGAALIDVQVQGSGRVAPDNPGYALCSAQAQGDRLSVGLAWPDAPTVRVYELVVESPAGFDQHRSGVWDIARASGVWFAGTRQEKAFPDSRAVRFLFG